MDNIFLILWLLSSVTTIWAAIAWWRSRHQRRTRLSGRATKPTTLIALAVSVVSFIGFGFTTPDESAATSKTPTTSTSYVVKHKTVRVGSKRLAAAKLESKTLAARAKKLESESASVSSTSESISSSVSSSSSSVAESRASSASAASVASSQSAASASSASRVAASSRAASSKTAASKSAASHQQTATSTKGDVYTGNVGRIIGNVNSKIYHVPGQSGYHMNSANAVYFASEQQAIAAGYRKAKR